MAHKNKKSFPRSEINRNFAAETIKPNTMSEATLTSLLEYLYGALTPSNQRWVAAHLVERANMEEGEALKPYTMEEVNAMLDEAEAEIAAGIGTPHEDVMREWDEEIACLEKGELIMAEAV